MSPSKWCFVQVDGGVEVSTLSPDGRNGLQNVGSCSAQSFEHTQQRWTNNLLVALEVQHTGHRSSSQISPWKPWQEHPDGTMSRTIATSSHTRSEGKEQLDLKAGHLCVSRSDAIRQDVAMAMADNRTFKLGRGCGEQNSLRDSIDGTDGRASLFELTSKEASESIEANQALDVWPTGTIAVRWMLCNERCGELPIFSP